MRKFKNDLNDSLFIEETTSPRLITAPASD